MILWAVLMAVLFAAFIGGIFYLMRLFQTESGVQLISAFIFFAPSLHRIHDRLQTISNIC